MTKLKITRLNNRIIRRPNRPYRRTYQAGNHIRLIGFVGFPGVRTLDIAGPLEVFTAAARLRQVDKHHDGYEVVVLGVNEGSFASQAGIIFRAQLTLESVRALDTLIVSGGKGLHQSGTLRQLSSWLSARAVPIRRYATISDGIYPLAHSGLIDGRTVTTHWRFAEHVANRFPGITVRNNAQFLHDGPFYTCAGGTAAIEMALSMVRDDLGSEVALTLARELSVRLDRFDGINGFDEMPNGQLGISEKIADLPAWIETHLDGDLSVPALSERANICPRHLARLFKVAFNKSPAAFVEDLRMKEARRRLHASRASVSSVAAAVGYTSPDVFRRAFERSIGVSPRAYRRALASVSVSTRSCE